MLIFVTFYFYQSRQVTPVENNRAANSLAEDIQIRNVRKVAVNARIAAVLCLLEFAANFSVVLVWIIIVGSSSAGGLTNSMLWFYIILPFTHLMNTSYNKDRVVDDGWKTVILNSVKSFFRYIVKLFKKDEKDEQESEQNPRSKTIRAENEQVKKSNFKERDISIISMEDDSNVMDLKIPQSVTCNRPLSEVPDTSKGKCSAQKAKGKIIFNHFSTDSDSEDNKITTTKSHRLRKGESLLSEMWNNVNNEEAYSHYFKQLLELEYPSNETTASHFKDFNVVPYDQCTYITQKYAPKHSKKYQQIHGSLIKCTKNLKNSRFEETPLNVNFVVNAEERQEQRKRKLERFLKNCEGEKDYDDFIKILISFEEELIAN